MNYYNSTTERVKIFAIRIIKIYTHTKDENDERKIIGKMLLEASVRLGVNIGEMQLAKTEKQLLVYQEISLRKIREISYYLELLIDAALVQQNKLQPLLKEINEIGNVVAKSIEKSK